ncbi:hypothetical protein FRC02_003737 [Tulasnella sp. 418]|nr:hypothetical protein FRC02_003737 [Tulasnella sp. 418]
MDHSYYIADISNQAFKLILSSLQENVLINDLGKASDDNAPVTSEKEMREADALSRILKLIESHIVQRVAELKQKRNELASHIHRLPNELLSLIFELVAHSIPLERPCSMTKRTLCSRFPFEMAAVCARWRGVVISTPRIWSYLCSKLASEEVQLYLTRSKESPLDIKFHGSWSKRFVSHVFLYIHRFRTLQASSQDLIELAERALEEGHAPLLESFSVWNTNTPSNRTVRGVKLFKHALHLRKLEIAHSCSISIEWESVYPLSKLTHLTICDLGEEEEGSPTGTQYHRLFKSLPCLEKVSINARQRAKPLAVSTEAIGKYDRIIHKNLWSLSLSNISATLALTVASFLYPTSCYFVYTRFFEWSMEPIDPETSIQLPKGNFIESVVSQVRRLRFDALPERQNPNVKIQGLTSETTWDYYRSDIPISDFRHVLHFELVTENPRSFLPLLSVMLPTTVTFKLLKSLRLTGRSSISLSDVDLPTRLTCLPSLEEIWLENFSRPESIAELKDIFKCLSTSIVDGVRLDEEERWICPNLSKVELHELAFHVADLLEMLRNRGMVEPIPGTPSVEGPARPLKLLVVDQCCTFSDSSSCGDLVAICNKQLAVTDESLRLVSYGECDRTHLEGGHIVIEIRQ